MHITKTISLFCFTAYCSAALISCTGKKTDTVINEVAQMDTVAVQAEVWHMEELYWQYVLANDTVSYKKLWHEDFIGYPSFGDGVADKSKIASWITKLHADSTIIFNCILTKKAVNVIGDVVIAFYDTDQTYTNTKTGEVQSQTSKFTHTCKKI